MTPIRWLACLALLCVLPAASEGAHFRTHLPLNGCRAYSTAKGSCTFTETIGETKKTDGTTLIIEVSNVPLPAGTELTVFVHEVEVGKLKLSKQRTGRLVLESGFRSSVPRITKGSFVTLKLEDGTTVIW